MTADEDPQKPTQDMIFGMETVLDIEGCPAWILEHKPKIRVWARALVKLLDMTAYEDTKFWHFGHDNPVTAGLTVLQLIETSSIMAHFSPFLGRVMVNVHSCKAFDPDLAARFTADYFQGRIAQQVTVIR